MQVMDAIERFNYIPNNLARSLKTKHTKTIGVIIPDVTEIYFTNILRGIEDELSRVGFNFLLCITEEDVRKETTYLNYFSQNHTDGIILATVAEDSKLLQDIIGKGKPIVCIDNLPNISIPYDAVINDNIQSVEIAINYLYKLNHRKIAFITGKQTETTGVERLMGFRKAMVQLGAAINEDIIYIGDFTDQSGYNAMNDLLGKNSGVTAVCIASAKMTYGAIRAVIESGKYIPGEISIVGFDVHDLTGGLLHPGITSIIQQENNIGKIACQLLIDKINNPEEHMCRKVLLQSQLVVKESCKTI